MARGYDIHTKANGNIEVTKKKSRLVTFFLVLILFGLMSSWLGETATIVIFALFGVLAIAVWVGKRRDEKNRTP